MIKKYFSQHADAVDVAEAGGEAVVVVGADSEGHAAGIVKLLADDFRLGLFNKSHHIVHRKIGESEFYTFHQLSLYNLSLFNRHAGCLTVGHDESGCAELDAAEIAHHDDYHVGESERIYLAEYRLAGGA